MFKKKQYFAYVITKYLLEKFQLKIQFFNTTFIRLLSIQHTDNIFFFVYAIFYKNLSKLIIKPQKNYIHNIIMDYLYKKA